MVALYKKVVVGFGFMVPDVKYNEAYISFLLVHPDWRRAGIATFMIYHLIQVLAPVSVPLITEYGANLRVTLMVSVGRVLNVCVCVCFRRAWVRT